MVKKQDWNSYLSKYGPNNPEPPQLKDSAKLRSEADNPLHAVEEYIESKS